MLGLHHAQSLGYNLCYPCRQQCSTRPAHSRCRGTAHLRCRWPSVWVRDARVQGRQAGRRTPNRLSFLLCYLACSTHLACCAALMGAPVTHWAAVPSLRPDAGPGKHPLHRLVAGLVPVPEVALSAASNVSRPRDFERGHFIAATPLTPRSQCCSSTIPGRVADTHSLLVWLCVTWAPSMCPSVSSHVGSIWSSETTRSS